MLLQLDRASKSTARNALAGFQRGGGDECPLRQQIVVCIPTPPSQLPPPTTRKATTAPPLQQRRRHCNKNNSNATTVINTIIIATITTIYLQQKRRKYTKTIDLFLACVAPPLLTFSPFASARSCRREWWGCSRQRRRMRRCTPARNRSSSPEPTLLDIWYVRGMNL